MKSEVADELLKIANSGDVPNSTATIMRIAADLIENLMSDVADAYEDAAKIAEQADGCVRDDPDDCTVGYEIARVFRAKAKEITG